MQTESTNCGLPTTWEQPCSSTKPLCGDLPSNWEQCLRTHPPHVLTPSPCSSDDDDLSTSAGCSSDREDEIKQPPSPVRPPPGLCFSSPPSTGDDDASSLVLDDAAPGVVKPFDFALTVNSPEFCPSLALPPGLSPVAQQSVGAPPGLELSRRPQSFDAAVFHKELVATLRDLSFDRNVGKAVRRVRAYDVPEERQAAEVTDILVRAAEEMRGPIRRSFFAFAAGLAAGTPPCFRTAECLEGIKEFFKDAYQGICEDSPRFPNVCAGELVPTLYSVFQAHELDRILPADMLQSASAVNCSQPEDVPQSAVDAPPGLEHCRNSSPQDVAHATPSPPTFDAAVFHKDIVGLMHDLSFDRDVAKAVRRVRSHRVPLSLQATEFIDILARAAEERRGPIRRSFFAFVAGLVAATPSAFDKAMCIKGLRMFFQDVYPSICEELPRFPSVAASELVPVLVSVVSAEQLETALPASLLAKFDPSSGLTRTW